MNRYAWLDQVMQHSAELQGKATSPASMVLVASVLATRYGSAQGTAWPSAPTVSSQCGLSPSAVRRAIRGLADAGWLAMVRRRRTSVEWRFTTPKSGHCAESRDPMSEHRAHPQDSRVGTVRAKSEHCARKSGHCANQTAEEPQKEPQLASLLPSLSEPGLTDDEIEAAIDWRIETRDSSKGPIKDPSRYRAWLRAEWTRDPTEAREVLGQRQRAIDEESERRARVEERERQLRELEQRAPDHLAPLLERAAKSAQVPRYRRATKPGRTQARSEPRHAPINTRIDSQADPAANRPRRAPA